MKKLSSYLCSVLAFAALFGGFFIAQRVIAATATVNSLQTNQTNPEISGTIDDPTANIKIKVTGPEINTPEYLASISGNTWRSTVRQTLSDGSYDVTVELWDSTYTTKVSEATFSKTLLVDSSIPTNTWVSPAFGTYASGTVALISQATDTAPAKVAKVDFYRTSPETLLGSTSTPDQNSNYSLLWNTAGVADGAYNVYSKATDQGGNVAATAPVTINVDNNPPVLDKTYSLGAARVTSSTTVEVRFNESLKYQTLMAENFAVYYSVLKDGTPNTSDTAPVAIKTAIDQTVTLQLSRPIAFSDSPVLAINPDGNKTGIRDLADNIQSNYDYTAIQGVAGLGVTISPAISVAKVNVPVALYPAGDTNAINNVASYTWDFGDGTTIPGTGVPTVISHSYTAAGVYDVKLNYTSTLGASGFNQATVVVGSAVYDTTLGATLSFPALAQDSGSLSIIKLATSAVSTQGFNPIGIFYDLNSNFATGTFIANITLNYPDTNGDGKVDGTNINEADLNAYYWDGSSWLRLPVLARDTDAGTIKVSTDRLTLIGLMSPVFFASNVLDTVTTSGGSTGSTGGGGGGGLLGAPAAPVATAAVASSTDDNLFYFDSLPQGQVLGVKTYKFNRQLKVGSTGDDVSELQKRLTAEGVYSGPITGTFGAETRKAVMSYQKKNKITATGTVGPRTLSQLNTPIEVLIPKANPTGSKQARLNYLQGLLDRFIGLATFAKVNQH